MIVTANPEAIRDKVSQENIIAVFCESLGTRSSWFFIFTAGLKVTPIKSVLFL
jgi:hypothetical protein